MERWRDFFDGETLRLLSSVLACIDESKQDIYPPRDEVLEMFVLLPPEKIKVIIIGQSPYSTEDACGIPFTSKIGNIPKSLSVIREEISLEYDVEIDDPNEMIRDWVRQGVFMINCAMTVGKSEKTYLGDHFVVWKEFIIRLVEYVGREHVPLLLFGKNAWELEEFSKSKCILKVPHPVSRGEKKFIGCNVFVDANKYLASTGTKKITWI